jgi:hypothetical protein
MYTNILMMWLQKIVVRQNYQLVKKKKITKKVESQSIHLNEK